MPTDTRFEISGELHAINARITSKGQLVTYDSNYTYRTKPEGSTEEVHKRIIDYKYIGTGEYAEQVSAPILIYYYQDKENTQLFDDFWIFPEDELPRKKDDATLFQRGISKNQWTHLHVAVMTHSLPVIKRLLADGYCDANAKDSFGRTVVDMIKDNVQDDILQLFIDSPNGPNLQNLFFTAVMNGNHDLVRKLCASNQIDVNEPVKPNEHSSPMLPLTVAMLANDVEMVECLAEAGADVTKSLRFQSSAISNAIRMRKQFYPLLIQHVKNINQQNEDDGDNFLHEAMRVSPEDFDANLVKDLLARGVDPNLPNQKGYTPLDIACCFSVERPSLLLPYVDEKALDQKLASSPSPAFKQMLTEEKQKRARRQFAFIGEPLPDKIESPSQVSVLLVSSPDEMLSFHPG